MHSRNVDFENPARMPGIRSWPESCLVPPPGTTNFENIQHKLTVELNIVLALGLDAMENEEFE